MKIVIEGEVKEIAALVRELQGQQVSADADDLGNCIISKIQEHFDILMRPEGIAGVHLMSEDEMPSPYGYRKQEE